MELENFKKELEKEYYNKINNKDILYPILDRVQIHLENLSGNYTLEQILSPNNLNHEIYLSLLYNLIFPIKYKKSIMIKFDGEIIEGKNERVKIQNIVIKVGVKRILELEKYKKFIIHKNNLKNVSSIYREVGNGYYFDTSFNFTGATSNFKAFIKEIKDKFNLNIQYEIKKIPCYN